MQRRAKLGREYTILNCVTGDNRGKRFGFPPAKLAPNEQFHETESISPKKLDELTYPGGELGFRPTVDAGKSERILERSLLILSRHLTKTRSQFSAISDRRKNRSVDALSANRSRCNRRRIICGPDRPPCSKSRRDIAHFWRLANGNDDAKAQPQPQRGNTSNSQMEIRQLITPSRTKPAPETTSNCASSK